MLKNGKRLTLIERVWYYNLVWGTVLFLAAAVVCIMQDAPGDNPGDNPALAGLGGAVFIVLACVTFLAAFFRNPSDWADRATHAIDTRGIRRGKSCVRAIPNGEYVKIETVIADDDRFPNLWPLSLGVTRSPMSDSRSFHAENDSERAMEYFNAEEARLSESRELTDGELEALALAEVLNR